MDFILTPNAREFEYMCKSLKISAKTNEEKLLCFNNVFKKPRILLKGEFDMFLDEKQGILNLWKAHLGKLVDVVQEHKGSARRCGGQGDILSGLIATLWNKSLKISDKECVRPSDNFFFKVIKPASLIMRKSATEALKHNGPSFLASELLTHIYKFL